MRACSIIIEGFTPRLTGKAGLVALYDVYFGT